jgi:hypothetical protein
MIDDKVFDFLEENQDLVNDGNIRKLVEQFNEKLPS